MISASSLVRFSHAKLGPLKLLETTLRKAGETLLQTVQLGCSPLCGCPFRKTHFVIFLILASWTNRIDAAEYAISAERIRALIGSRVDVQLFGDMRFENALLKHIATPRKAPNEIRLITIKLDHESRSRRLRPNSIDTIRASNLQLGVQRSKNGKFHLIDLKKKRFAIEDRLGAKRERLWTPFSDAEHDRFVSEGKEFLQRVKKHYTRLRMHLSETKYFLFLTDIPRHQLAPYIQNLDVMNEELGKAFGLPKGHNIWRGKAVIVAFNDRAMFLDFEKRFMNNPNAAGAQGICHSASDGNVVVGCFRGSRPNVFASVLVHETAHGYLHRYKSTARIPSWLNEGIADWVAAIAVPVDTTVKERQRDAALRLRATNRLGTRIF